VIEAGLRDPDWHFTFHYSSTVFTVVNQKQNQMRDQSVSLNQVAADGCPNAQTVRRR
jgi:hypothetical protein